MAWSKDPHGDYQLTTRIPAQLSHVDLAWAIFATFEGSLRQIGLDGSLTFSASDEPIPRREVQEQVLRWLAFNGVDALWSRGSQQPGDQAQMPSQHYLKAAALVWQVPPAAQVKWPTFRGDATHERLELQRLARWIDAIAAVAAHPHIRDGSPSKLGHDLRVASDDLDVLLVGLPRLARIGAEDARQQLRRLANQALTSGGEPLSAGWRHEVRRQARALDGLVPELP